MTRLSSDYFLYNYLAHFTPPFDWDIENYPDRYLNLSFTDEKIDYPSIFGIEWYFDKFFDVGRGRNAESERLYKIHSQDIVL